MLVGILWLTVHGFSGDDIYIISTKYHTVCKFPDGSYFEEKTRHKWLFYAEPIAHAQKYSSLDEMQVYRDANWRRRYDVPFGLGDSCSSVGRIGQRTFTSMAYQDKDGNWVHTFKKAEDTGDYSPLPQYPTPISTFRVERPAEINQFFDKEHLLTAAWNSIILPLDVFDRTILFEQAITAHLHPTIEQSTVLYVYQALSEDGGKTWSKPIITKEAKLYEIGKLLTQQSWSAKLTKTYQRNS